VYTSSNSALFAGNLLPRIERVYLRELSCDSWYLRVFTTIIRKKSECSVAFTSYNKAFLKACYMNQSQKPVASGFDCFQ